MAKNHAEYSAISILPPDNDNCYWVKGVKMILPETAVPTIALKIPEMKNKTSYWQIGTASVNRVKISALSPDVQIYTEEAHPIDGMFSELFRPIDSLGVAIIRIFDKPIKVYVTRSANTAPVVADGVLGPDFLDAVDATLNLGRKTLTIGGQGSSIPILEGKDLIPNYSTILRRRMIASTVESERGPWSTVTKDLANLRRYLPEKIGNDESAPIIEILEYYVDCFHIPGEKLAATKFLRYTIKSRETTPIYVAQHDLTADEEAEIEQQVNILLKQGIIGHSSSPYNSPVKLIDRKPDSRGNIHRRLTADFHELNNRSIGDSFTVPDIIDLFDQLHGSNYFTVLDLASACYQIDLAPEDRKKTAFTTRRGRYEFKRMPAGIKCASATVQRLLCEVLRDMLAANIVFVYYDDILIHANSVAEHEVRVRRVLSLLRKAGLKLQPDKCQLFQPSVMYLGHLVTYEGLRPDPAKIEKLIAEEMPMTPHDMSSYLGLLSHFKRFMPDFTSRCKPMYNLLKNKTSIKWNDEAIESYRDLKKEIAKDHLLRYPDWSAGFILETSATRYGFNAALLQQKSDEFQPWPIAYASRNYLPEEMKYNKYDKELAAAMYGMENWYWYFRDLEPKEFVLRTAEPSAFEKHDSEVREVFERKFSGQNFKVEPLTK